MGCGQSDVPFSGRVGGAASALERPDVGHTSLHARSFARPDSALNNSFPETARRPADTGWDRLPNAPARANLLYRRDLDES